jgi:hypothetical protein
MSLFHSDDASEFTTEEIEKTQRYMRALDSLVREFGWKFEKNRNIYLDIWNTSLRLWWIGQIEKQAQAGANTIGVIVVSRVVQMRLDEG